MMDFRGGGAEGIAIYHSAVNSFEWDRLLLASNSALIAGAYSTQFSKAGFQHWAVCRDASNVVRGFIKGVQVWSVTDTRTYASSASVFVGDNYLAPSQPSTCSLDECRITKGIARYTANFTPPTAPFPNS